MNKIIFICSTILIIFTHLFALTYTYEKKDIPIHKPKYQKITLQRAKFIEAKPIIKEIKKPIQKQIVKKEVFKKPIKKDAKRKLVKKIQKKKIEKKKIQKKVIVKKIEKKEIKKKIEKKEIIEKKVSNIDAAQSLAKVNKYKNNYTTALRAAIDRNKKYPNSSRRLKEQGTVIVGFRVLKSGVFENMRIIKTSGKKRLDKAALKALLKTTKFKSFSKEIPQSYMDLSLAIQFTLK